MDLPVPQDYLYNAPSGYAGDVTRSDETNVEPIKYASGQTPGSFGIPVVYNGSGEAIVWGGSNVAADFQGVLVREVPAIGGNALGGLSDVTPNVNQMLGNAVRGYVAVKCAAGTPVRGGIVYIQVTASGGVAVGEFRASSDGGNAVALSATQAEWASNGKDASNIAELRIAR